MKPAPPVTKIFMSPYDSGGDHSLQASPAARLGDKTGFRRADQHFFVGRKSTQET
jgi:hypothetical protein